MNRNLIFRLCAVCMICFGLSGFVWSQVQTRTQTETGTPSYEIQVERGEVVYVSGNDLILKMDNGEIRHFPNVPDSARATVNGREIGIRDVKVGMKLQRTITTTTTPTVVTTVQTLQGKVWKVMPPHLLILTLENGKNERFNVPEGQTFKVGGATMGLRDLRQGMKIHATKVVTSPISFTTQDKRVTGSMPPPPPPDVPILIVEQEVAPAPVAELPKTASLVPLLGLAGMLALGLGIGLGVFRRII